MGTPWRNADGLVVRFDGDAVTPRDPRGEAPGAGYERYVDFIVDLTKTTAATAYNEWGAKLPANSFVVGVQATELVAVTGATAFTVGTQYYDGTAWVANGLISAVTGIGTTGDKTVTAGSQVGTLLVSPANLIVTTTGQATAGKYSFRIRILVPGKAADVVWHGA